ncbi:MAG: glycosyltransferase family 4 protein [Dehalococcoidia bacterium]
MDIAQITSTYLSVPPKSHGGTELMVYHLVEGLVGRGHDVELFASGDSRVSGKLNAVVDVATSYDDGATFYIDKEMEARNTYNLYRQGDRFDIIHAHWPTLAPYFSGLAATPTIVTYAYIERPLHEYYRADFPNVHPVCVSKSQARMLGEEDLPVVYNGIDLANVPYGHEPEDFLVIVGRIAPNKGIADAIRIAEAAGERLVIVGAVTPYLPWSRQYYEEQVEPLIDGDRVRHIQHLSNREVLELVARARAFLFPLQWEEPFGLAVAEAMAAGTPVVTYAKGAMPEVVIDGETGFLVESEEEAVQALTRIGEIDRGRCRRSIEERFPIDGMVTAYETLYRRLCRDA